MARKGWADRGIYSAVNAAGKVRWWVRIYHRYRARKFGSFRTKMEARECYAKARLLIRAGLFKPEYFYLRGISELAEPEDGLNAFAPDKEGVYFVQCRTTGHVKIGYSRSIRRRLSALQTANPKQLVFLGWIPGDSIFEKSLHDKFLRYRVRGEWFMVEGDLAAFLLATDTLIKPQEAQKVSF